MTVNAFLQCAVFLVLILSLSKPWGTFMARVYNDGAFGPFRFLAPIEKRIYRLIGADPEVDMTWKEYARSMLVFNAIGFLMVYAIQRTQLILPGNPLRLAGVTPDSAFNTAMSFVTNTNWQGYSGETTMSYLTQSAALTVQNFLSAATGLACVLPLARGFARKQTDRIGNFWVDMTRSVVYVLLPISFALALILVSRGVIQTMRPSVAVTPLDAAPGETQTIARGPVASQIAIKQLGTNGGGFFNANGAHPFENPTAWTNVLEAFSILWIPAACCWMWGSLVGDARQGRALLGAMTLLFVPLLAMCVHQEGRPAAARAALGAQAAQVDFTNGNMEGKETRNGVTASAIWAAATSAASNGSVNAMHDSFTPLGGLVPLFLIQMGEVVFGGVGSGLYGMVLFAVIAVFLSGLMVGRTPEYMGKKLDAFDIKMACLGILIPCAVVLAGTGVAVLVPAGTGAVLNTGPHGFSEILYAFSSAGNNNGSAFAGLSANTPFYNAALGLSMFLGRYGVAVPTLALAGSLSKKKSVPPSAGTLPTHSPLFVVLLAATVILVGALTFFPSLALGPLAEHFTITGAAS